MPSYGRLRILYGEYIERLTIFIIYVDLFCNWAHCSDDYHFFSYPIVFPEEQMPRFMNQQQFPENTFNYSSEPILGYNPFAESTHGLINNHRPIILPQFQPNTSTLANRNVLRHVSPGFTQQNHPLMNSVVKPPNVPTHINFNWIRNDTPALRHQAQPFYPNQRNRNHPFLPSDANLPLINLPSRIEPLERIQLSLPIHQNPLHSTGSQMSSTNLNGSMGVSRPINTLCDTRVASRTQPRDNIPNAPQVQCRSHFSRTFDIEVDFRDYGVKKEDDGIVVSLNQDINDLLSADPNQINCESTQIVIEAYKKFEYSLKNNAIPNLIIPGSDLKSKKACLNPPTNTLHFHLDCTSHDGGQYNTILRNLIIRASKNFLGTKFKFNPTSKIYAFSLTTAEYESMKQVYGENAIYRLFAVHGVLYESFYCLFLSYMSYLHKSLRIPSDFEIGNRPTSLSELPDLMRLKDCTIVHPTGTTKFEYGFPLGNIRMLQGLFFTQLLKSLDMDAKLTLTNYSIISEILFPTISSTSLNRKLQIKICYRFNHVIQIAHSVPKIQCGCDDSFPVVNDSEQCFQSLSLRDIHFWSHILASNRIHTPENFLATFFEVIKNVLTRNKECFIRPKTSDTPKESRGKPNFSFIHLIEAQTDDIKQFIIGIFPRHRLESFLMDPRSYCIPAKIMMAISKLFYHLNIQSLTKNHETGLLSAYRDSKDILQLFFLEMLRITPLLVKCIRIPLSRKKRIYDNLMNLSHAIYAEIIHDSTNTGQSLEILENHLNSFLALLNQEKIGLEDSNSDTAPNNHAGISRKRLYTFYYHNKFRTRSDKSKLLAKSTNHMRDFENSTEVCLDCFGAPCSGESITSLTKEDWACLWESQFTTNEIASFLLSRTFSL